LDLSSWPLSLLINIQTAQSLHPGGEYYPEGKRQQELEEKRSWKPIGQSDYVHVASNENSKFEGMTMMTTQCAG